VGQKLLEVIAKLGFCVLAARPERLWPGRQSIAPVSLLYQLLYIAPLRRGKVRRYPPGQTGAEFGECARGRIVDRVLDVATERVVAISRSVLALGGLIAIYLDPAQPSQGPFAYAFVATYAAFAFALLVFVLSARRAPARNWSLASHGLEVALVSLIIWSSEGPLSPFFVYFTFVLLVAALRWQGRGALMTGAVLTLVLVVLSTSALVTHVEPADLDRLVLRNVYLLVASILIAFFGDELGRSYQRLERLQFARELHDGVLQALTAARLKLHAAASVASSDQRQQLLDVSQLLVEEQRHIRTFVEQSQTDGYDASDQRFVLSDLQAFIDHLKRLWSCDIDFDGGGSKFEIPIALGRALKAIVAESVANAVVHGNAKQITISIANARNSIGLQIKDNGSGLNDLNGAFDDRQLDTQGIGPRSLRERIAGLGGLLRLTSSPQGVELYIELPVSSAP
jgi:signal transduction histidine kinase